MRKKILVVEDELEIQAGLRNFLKDVGYEVETADDGLAGAYKLQQENYDLIILDVMMPKMDGYAVLELIRKTSEVPIIMLTAMGAEEDQLKGFDLHADDYITKPFSMNVVLKRIEAVFRRNTRSKGMSSHKLLTYKEMVLNLSSCEVSIDGQKLSVTDKEYELLKLLAENPGQVFTREDLLEQLWEEDFFGSDHVVNVHIGNLRKKINRDYIQTVHRKGYRFAYEDKA